MRACFTKRIGVILILSLFIFGCNQAKKEWEMAKVSNSVPEIQKFLDENPNSKFSIDAKNLLDSLDCKKANCVIIFTNGTGISYGKETASFGTGGMNLILEGSSYVPSVLLVDQTKANNSGLLGTPIPIEPAVYIWRSFSDKEVKIANEKGLKTGLAYLKYEAVKYRVIRIVDLKKSEKEICKEFGVEVTDPGKQQIHSK